MPSTYAHYRMGKEVAEELTGEAWHTLSMYRQLYLIGLHGPDILFYYKPLKSNVINGIGYGMHCRPGVEFFEHAFLIGSQTSYRFSFVSNNSKSFDVFSF